MITYVISALTLLFSGFRQANFLETTIRGRDVIVPVMSNNFCGAHAWASYVKDIPLASAWLQESDGSNTAWVLSRYSGSIRAFTTKGKLFFNLFEGANVLNGMRSFKIDDDHDLLTYRPGSDNTALEWWKTSYSVQVETNETGFLKTINPRINASASLSQRYVYRGNLAGYGFFSDWESGVKRKRIFTVTPHGRLSVIDLTTDPKGLSPIAFNLPIGKGIVSGAYSDGKLSKDEKYDLLLWGHFSSGAPILYCTFDPKTSSFESHAISPVLVGSVPGITDQTVPTISPIAEAFQFWVGDNDWRIIVRYRNGNFLSLDRDGRIVEAPIINSVNGGFRNVRSLSTGFVNTMSSCNNRKSWRYCNDLMLFEDFSNGNDGVRRMEWIPDGYKYLLPIEVWMRDVSTEGNISKPQIVLKNRSTWKEAKKITVRVWHSKAEEESQTIVSDLYYSYLPGTRIHDGVSVGNSNISYTDIDLPDDFTLSPGDSTVQDGIQLGVHFNGYYPGVWDRANDWSWVSPVSAEYQQNQNVTVYTRGDDGVLNKIFGTDPSADFVRRPIVVAPQDVFGMEDVSLWEYPLALSLSERHTEGNWGVRVPVSGYNLLVSRPLALPTTPVKSISFDVFVDETQPNPYWVGDLQLSLNIPSQGVYNAYIGYVGLTEFTRGKFTNCYLPIPEWLLAKLSSGAKDARWTIAVNGNFVASPLVIDNMYLK